MPIPSRSNPSPLRPLVLLLLVSIGVYWIGLGQRPFAASEGHRVGPAWAMLASGDYWHVRLFEQLYLRKPPGMPWAIAGLSSLLGQTEFAARAVSALAATLAAVVTYLFARRWFGPRSAIAAGLSQALMPLLWNPGRTAEIEALHNLGIQIACLAMIDLALLARRIGTPPLNQPRPDGLRLSPAPDDSPASLPLRPMMAVILAAGIVLAAITKGPAGAAVLAGVLLAIPLARMVRWRAQLWIALGAGLAIAVLVPLARRILAAHPPADTITQDTREFLWAGGFGAIGRVLKLVPMAFITALPVSAALMFPWGKDARAEALDPGHPNPAAARAFLAARLCGFAWFSALGIMVVAGVTNPRYAMPAAALLPPLVAYIHRGAWGVHATFNDPRRRLVKRIGLNNPGAWPVLLTTAAVLAGVFMPKSKDDSLTAGRALAAMLPHGGEVWADALVEARPDVLLYARQAQPQVRPLWRKPEMQRGSMPPRGAYILLRTDAEGDETQNYKAALAAQTLTPVGEGKVGRYSYRLYRRPGISSGDAQP